MLLLLLLLLLLLQHQVAPAVCMTMLLLFLLLLLLHQVAPPVCMTTIAAAASGRPCCMHDHYCCCCCCCIRSPLLYAVTLRIKQRSLLGLCTSEEVVQLAWCFARATGGRLSGYRHPALLHQ